MSESPIIRPNRKSLIVAPFGKEFEKVRQIARTALKDTGFEVVPARSVESYGLGVTEMVIADISHADFIVAIISAVDDNVFYELGLAHGVGKPILFVAEQSLPIKSLLAQNIGLTLQYENSPEGMDRLRRNLRSLLESLNQNPQAFEELSPKVGQRSSNLPNIEFGRLGEREFENLCFELLTLMGFRRLGWGKELKEVDAIATFPKKDPDGFEYNELWLISMGLHVPAELLIDMVAREPDYFLQPIRLGLRGGLHQGERGDIPATVTLLIILFDGRLSSDSINYEMRRLERRVAERRFPFTLRLRVWDKHQLSGLVRQYPQLAYKYFSDEGRAQSKYRKSPEELYRELVDANERLQSLVLALKEERDKRVKAERDAVWKDVAFRAAHKLGNPVFALETALQGMKRRIKANPDEALEVAGEMVQSIEKAKTIIEQFKSLIRAQEISPRPVRLGDLIGDASRVASQNGVSFQLEVKDDPKIQRTMADPIRMSECFDELFANALHWFDKDAKQIHVVIDSPKKKELPEGLDGARACP